MQWRKLTKEERDQNYVNKSSILNEPRVVKRFTDITTTTTHNNYYYYYYNKNYKNNANKNNNDKENNTAYTICWERRKLVVYTVENMYYNTCNWPLQKIPQHTIMLFVCHPKILHKHCFQFLLGVKMAPRDTENNAYAKFWGDKQRALWYVMVFLEWSIGSHQ